MAVISRRTRHSSGIDSRRSAPAYVAFVAILVTFVLSMSGATANAAVDSSNSIVDGKGNTLTATQSDTSINFVQPLDGNPLTREWFHNGVASYTVSGPDAEAFGGGMTIGYQVGYPATLNGQITFNYSTPSLSFDLSDSSILARQPDPVTGRAASASASVPASRTSRPPLARSPGTVGRFGSRTSTAP